MNEVSTNRKKTSTLELQACVSHTLSSDEGEDQARLVAEGVKLPPANTDVPSIQVSVGVLAALLALFPANGLGKAMEDDAGVWAPVMHIGDPKETPGSCLWPCPVLAVGLSK